MMNYSGFTEPQTEYIKRSFDCWLNIAEGGKRAGKNVLNIIAFAIAIEQHKDNIFLAAGVTEGAAWLNIIDSNGFGLKYLFDGKCREGKYGGKRALFVDLNGHKKVIVVEGGGKSNVAA